jgi:chorismate mutase/prephenate dehydratase
MSTERIGALRDDIERIDQELVRLIAERVRVARAVGATKREASQPTLDHAREATVVRRAVTLARDAGLSHDEEIRQIFWTLIGLCRRVQMNDV